MTQDEQHLNLLSIFHYVVGGITALWSCVFLIHVGLGIAMVCGAFEGRDAPPPFMGWFFILIPGLFILCGWTLAALIVTAGVRLKRRVSYTFCLVIAGVECILMPYGTILGVFTILVLLRESVKGLFGVGQD